MGLVYILVRTFPFWGIPLGFALLVDWMRAGSKGKGKRTKFSFLYPVLAFALIGGGALYFLKGGHKNAVPFMYEVFNSPAPASTD